MHPGPRNLPTGERSPPDPHAMSALPMALIRVSRWPTLSKLVDTMDPALPQCMRTPQNFEANCSPKDTTFEVKRYARPGDGHDPDQLLPLEVYAGLDHRVMSARPARPHHTLDDVVSRAR